MYILHWGRCWSVYRVIWRGTMDPSSSNQERLTRRSSITPSCAFSILHSERSAFQSPTSPLGSSTSGDQPSGLSRSWFCVKTPTLRSRGSSCWTRCYSSLPLRRHCVGLDFTDYGTIASHQSGFYGSSYRASTSAVCVVLSGLVSFAQPWLDYTQRRICGTNLETLRCLRYECAC